VLKTGILMCSLTLVTATPSNAQEVTKPRTTTTTDRPPPAGYDDRQAAAGWNHPGDLELGGRDGHT
jgi:hypothetical protein